MVLGNVFPEPNSSAAGTRMIHWLEFFKAQSFEIIYGSTSERGPFSADLAEWVSEEKVVPLNNDDFNSWLKEIQPAIVLYDRFMVEEQFSWRIRKELPNCIHLLETQDLHFLRESRVKKSSLFNDITKREIASILRCDLTFVLSEFEYNLLAEKFNYTIGKVLYYPLCYDVADFKQEENGGKIDFCFIGNFLHEPNRQAVLYLKKIWKEIRTKLPQINLHVYGAYPTQQIAQLHKPNEGFFVHGRTDSVEKVFRKHRVLLAPILSGAGLKGKLLEAMKYGILSVTTPCGSEGISTSEKWNGRVVEIEDFIQASCEIYQVNSNEYLQFQEVGREILTQKFDTKKYQDLLKSQLENILSDIELWRNKNFLSEIMNHHRQQSVRYLSHWISAKQNQNK